MFLILQSQLVFEIKFFLDLSITLNQINFNDII